LRTLTTILVCLLVMAGASSALARAGAASETRRQATAAGFTLATPDLHAVLSGSKAAGVEKVELVLATGVVQARLFRDKEVSGNFTGSRLRFGPTERSPYLAMLGVGDGVSARVRSGSYSLAATVVSGSDGDSVAGEVTAFRGAVALQVGHRRSGSDVGAASFGGAHVDFDVMEAVVSVRWHTGQEEDSDGSTRRSSAGGIAVDLRSVMEDGDHLRGAMSRPVRPRLGFEAPDVSFSYMMPTSLGRLICAGGFETAAQTSTVRVSWGLAW